MNKCYGYSLVHIFCILFYADLLTQGLGTTSSAPVYDRSVYPPIFAGVVGLDFSFSAMEKALGDESDAGKEEVINRMVLRSIAKCPEINIDECQRESLSSEYEQCANTCSSGSSYEISKCNNVEYPSNVWNNKKLDGWSYEQRTCCSVGEIRKAGTMTIDFVKDHVCVPRGLSTGAIIGIVLGVSIPVVSFIC